MTRGKNHSTEQVVNLLRQLEVGVAKSLVRFVSRPESRMWFRVNEYRNIVSFLGDQCPRLVLGHIVLKECRHFSRVIHPSPIVIRTRPPYGGQDGWVEVDK